MVPFSRDIADYPDGIVLPIDKPYRWTSADVVRKIKYSACRHFGKKNLKVGHAGTLDPLATGILLVCIGNATKRAEELQRSPKQYLAGVSFGATTPSYDLEKDVDREFSLEGITEDAVRAVLPRFVGEQMQVAPLFSAKSVDGVRAYETARRLLRESQRTGVPFSDHDNILSSSLVNIYALTLEEFFAPDTFAASAGASDSPGQALPLRGSLPLEPRAASLPNPETPAEATLSCRSLPLEQRAASLPNPDVPSPAVPSAGFAASAGAPSSPGRNQVSGGRINVADVSGYRLATAIIRVDCSKGTYIRALARDLGESLDNGAFLSSLRRTRNGGYDISEAVSMEDALSLLGGNP